MVVAQHGFDLKDIQSGKLQLLYEGLWFVTNCIVLDRSPHGGLYLRHALKWFYEVI